MQSVGENTGAPGMMLGPGHGDPAGGIGSLQQPVAPVTPAVTT
jgi:hypothetical protein